MPKLRTKVSPWLRTAGQALLVGLLLGGLTPVEASTITIVIDEFNGEFFDITDPYPRGPVTIGTFSFSLPSDRRIVSAVITGSFGNSVQKTSAGVDLSLDGVQVASCVKPQPCWADPPIDEWSAAVPLSVLQDNIAVLTGVQTSEYVVRTGAATLTITVPETNPALLFLFGVVMSQWVWRRHSRHSI